jgi:two-component system CheB/CheR fusion protein
MRDPSSHPLRVLVVDDHQDNRESLGLLLQALGYDVRLAADGPSALEVARSFRPQAVLLDIGLPGQDGWEVAARLRRHEVLPGALLVAVSGYGREQDLVRSREVGLDAHLTKPADLTELTRLLGPPRVPAEAA